MPSRTPRDVALEDRRAEFRRLKRWRRDRYEAIERAIAKYAASSMPSSYVGEIEYNVKRVIQFHMLRRLCNGFSGAVRSYTEYMVAREKSGEFIMSWPLSPAIHEQMNQDAEWFDVMAHLLNYRLYKYQTRTFAHNCAVDSQEARRRLKAYERSEPDFATHVQRTLLYDKKCHLLLDPEESDQAALAHVDEQEKRYVCDTSEVGDMTHALEVAEERYLLSQLPVNDSLLVQHKTLPTAYQSVQSLVTMTTSRAFLKDAYAIYDPWTILEHPDGEIAVLTLKPQCARCGNTWQYTLISENATSPRAPVKFLITPMYIANILTNSPPGNAAGPQIPYVFHLTFRLDLQKIREHSPTLAAAFFTPSQLNRHEDDEGGGEGELLPQYVYVGMLTLHRILTKYTKRFDHRGVCNGRFDGVVFHASVDYHLKLYSSTVRLPVTDLRERIHKYRKWCRLRTMQAQPHVSPDAVRRISRLMFPEHEMYRVAYE